MTAHITHDPDGPGATAGERDPRHAPDDPGALLDQVRHQALALLAEMPETPRSLRIRVADVDVGIEWETPAAAGGAAGSPAEPARPGAGAPGPESPAPSRAHHLTAPTVGVFYQAPEPGAEPYVREGDVVAAGQQVAIVEAMKLMIPVEADRPGRIAEVLKENGAAVEYGEPLFALAPLGDEAPDHDR
ncbi:acetyl-CoA carboxylase biotin carboxyl carrier protein [Microbispora rosea]|uniref:acetyl-CoA carboxylase biotin carboxyl carrier protein n=1 Tax=Microbispora rosea TaxID=58117 RepID=UPI00341A58F3